MKPYLLIALTSLFGWATFFSCSPEPRNFQIQAHLTGFPDSTLFQLKNLSTDLVEDSAWLVQGKLTMSGYLPQSPEQLWFSTTLDNQLIYTTLLIGNEKIELEADRTDFPWWVVVRGSTYHGPQADLTGRVAGLNQARDSVVKQLFALMGAGKQAEAFGPGGLAEQMRAIDEALDSLTHAFIRNHPDTYTALIQLGYQKEAFSKDSLRTLFATFSPELQQSRFGKLIQVHLAHDKPIPGQVVPDFVAEDTLGQAQQFSQLMDSYVLLDFTGTYCGPCIESIPELKEVQATYSDRLKVLSFSTDAGKDVWLKGVRRDQIEWMSLWDGQGNYSETKLKYGVQGIPHFFLISPSGTLMAENRGYGAGSVSELVKNHLSEDR